MIGSGSYLGEAPILIINNYQVELLDPTAFAEQMAMTMSFSDLYDPSQITDTYTKTIDLPGTTRNNTIFGEIWNVNTTTRFFNPSKLSDFKIILNGMLWQKGSIELTGITINDKSIMYHVNLYGSLTNVLCKLFNNDIDDDNNKLLRSLKFPNQLKHPISIASLNSIWNGYYTSSSVHITDYMAYVPAQNGLYNNFDSNNELRRDASNNLVVKPICDENFNLSEYERDEYRPQYQRPAIKMDKLINQIILDASLDSSIRLDPDFFNQYHNSYWKDTYLTLSQYTTDSTLETVKADVSVGVMNVPPMNTTVSATLQFKQTDGNLQIFGQDFSTTINLDNTSTKNLNLEFDIMVKAYVPGSLNTYDVYLNYTGSGRPYDDRSSVNWPRWNIRTMMYNDDATVYGFPIATNQYTNNAMEYVCGLYRYLSNNVEWNWYNHFTFYDYEGSSKVFAYVFNENRHLYGLPVTVDEDDPTIDDSPFLKHVGYTFDGRAASGEGEIVITLFGINHTLASTNRQRDIAASNVRYEIIVKGVHLLPDDTKRILANYGFTGNDMAFNGSTSVSYGTTVGTRDMFDRETTQGDILVNYTKLLGCIYDTDIDGNITIMPRNKYFNNYKIIDWTRKVDRSKDFVITPLTFNSKNLEMKYTSGKSYYETLYENQFGSEFGSHKINTGYAFNTDTTNMIDTLFTNTIMSKDRRTSISVSGTKTVVTTETPYILPAYYTKKGEERSSTDTKYNLLFKNGTQSTTNPIYISADVEDMFSENNSNACWVSHSLTGYNLIQSRNTLPFFTTHNDTCSWDLGYPRVSYDGANVNTYSSDSTIYSRFWKNYIAEIYNVNNRIVTCYVMLDYLDILSFSFRNFIHIDNTLYHVNKIIDANPATKVPTKVELITIQDINAYTSGQNYSDLLLQNYSVTNVLSGVTSSNTAAVVGEGESYTTYIVKDDPEASYTTLNITMGGVDITSTAWSSSLQRIYVASVTGPLVITITATVVSNYNIDLYINGTYRGRETPTAGSSYSRVFSAGYGYSGIKLLIKRKEWNQYTGQFEWIEYDHAYALQEIGVTITSAANATLNVSSVEHDYEIHFEDNYYYVTPTINTSYYSYDIDYEDTDPPVVDPLITTSIYDCLLKMGTNLVAKVWASNMYSSRSVNVLSGSTNITSYCTYTQIQGDNTWVLTVPYTKITGALNIQFY